MTGPQPTLLSKIQYKLFEPGEFILRQKRTYPETIQLIREFPWEKERDHLTISLTNPSVTIEGPQGDFLKLALYYQGKFVLHYFSKDRKLYSKSFTDLSNTDSYILAFFSVQPFPLKDFHQEPTWLQNNLPHFADGNFQYTINRPIALRYGLFWFGPALLFIVISLILLTQAPPAHWTALVPILILQLITLPGARVLINHYRFARCHILILSRGIETFYYGEHDKLVEYNKNMIREIVAFGGRGRYKAPEYNQTLARVEVFLTDGNILTLSTLMLDWDKLKYKLPECNHSYMVESFPFISLSASSPSG